MVMINVAKEDTAKTDKLAALNKNGDWAKAKSKI